MQWPIGMAQKLPSQKHEIRLALPDDGIGLSGIGDQAYCAGADSGFAAVRYL